MSRFFATLTLLGACHSSKANAQWADLGIGGQPFNGEQDQYYHNSSSPSTLEGKHLAFLMGMEDNRIPMEASNSLDEMATAMLGKNAEYVDSYSHEIPTFHVLHSETSSIDE